MCRTSRKLLQAPERQSHADGQVSRALFEITAELLKVSKVAAMGKQLYNHPFGTVQIPPVENPLLLP